MAESQQSALANIQSAITEQRFESALSALEPILAERPDHADALYMQAVCHRYLCQFDAAQEPLQKLMASLPTHGRAHQEQGHLYRAMKKPDMALAAYARACRLNPALVASFRARVELLHQLGRQREATTVEAQLRRLERLPKPLIAATDLIAQGKLLRAEDICRKFLKKFPHHVEGMRLLADVGVRLGVLDDAELLLASAAAFEPENVAARIDYVQVLRKRQRFAAALKEAEELLATDPANPQFQSIYAVVSMQIGHFDDALTHFDKVLEKLPGDAVTWTSKGHALKTGGRSEAAVEAYRQAYRHQPQHGEAYYSLSNLKTYRFTDDELRLMVDQETNAEQSTADRAFLYFALGKAHEDRGDYESSFGYYRQGNALKKAESRYDAQQMSADLAAQQQSCTEALFRRQDNAGCDAPDPIFIVGLPRAGSTLLEQILSSHSQVDGTHELPNILSLAHRLRRGVEGSDSGYPEVLGDLSAERLRELGDAFITDTRIHRQGAPLFIDKMPNNFRHLGLIKLILPNAKVIDARRHPMSCCFSAYKQLFAEGQEFSYDLHDLGQYYSDYVQLMDHWDEVLPGFVLRVQHEDVVADLESQVRRMLDFCGLPFEEACIRYYETERNVRTPSSEQVRQPIFTQALEQWRHYEPWLDPLKESLGTVLASYPMTES
tara:strand:- start:3944 stop:5938 length:1995 start_codon:yes stop_codon:yes gene_type:complete